MTSATIAPSPPPQKPLEEEDEKASRRLSFWRSHLASLTELQLPTDYPRPIPHRIVEATMDWALPPSTAMALLQLMMAASQIQHSSKGEDDNVSSPFSMLLAAFTILLHKYTGEQDIVVGSSSLNLNPLVLRLKCSHSDSILDVIRHVSQAEAEALRNEIPFANLMKSCFKSNQPSINNDNNKDDDGDMFQPSVFKTPTLRRLLPIQLRVVFNSVLFSEHRIKDMLDQLQLVIESSASAITLRGNDQEKCKIGNISLVTHHARTVIPNPTANLHWDDFQGSITDIFARNASLFPDRVCVVESRENTTTTTVATIGSSLFQNLRSFSYKTIHEASNILAHKLIQGGIERDDVVVLYSYRGVDLVIAVMGVLKAGATFSVIDPAYPPSRQNIYLSVAQPQGLVILEKAGVLHADVRDYISSNLVIKVEIPALCVADDGFLRGGGSGLDVLDNVRNLADVNTGVILGPDSIGTLSFTSGSTGIPKGVRGRHFSLTHFYPWMRQEFEMSEQERFTMLSGIAHDPIQRDIFTPLFLGAQLRIPTAEDIGTPGRLAEWMAFHEISVTHLTPAMGQLLSANATQFIPSLKNAFFVGDILTKRDVNRLQYLAPNTHIINMYGTTETQRAVSYLKIPPSSINPGFLSEQKDIMAAGRGMRNVQLLVINAVSGLQCGIGEVGEIYVRSGGLAEGYLKLDDVTASKFLVNPFNKPVDTTSGGNGDVKTDLPYYLGPRDRMYKTGDLGRYRPDGAVECTGRADDQVKIRGFRIELGEIDTHLSQHPLVRENVTLVRRDKYEEQTLVSYFVPLEAPKDMAELLKVIREYLRLKLPSYAVPSVFVPLIRMPLTPNGKVDKNALPFPDTALLASLIGTTSSSSSSAPGNTGIILNQTQTALRDIWAALLGCPSDSLALDDAFFDRGGHSVLATQLVFEIRKKMAVVVPLGIVYKEPTLRGMADEIDLVREHDLNIVQQEPTDGDHHQRSSSGGGFGTATGLGKRRLRATKSSDSMGNSSTDDEDDGIVNYAQDAVLLDDPLAISVDNLPPFVFPIATSSRPLTFFVTGVTGFLGAFILSSLLKRYHNSRVICHVRAKSTEDALKRVADNGARHLVWEESWATADRVRTVCGDLALPKLGISDHEWNQLASNVDVIIHNGALVHWVYPYERLRAPNVIGTVEALRLATTHHAKPFHFVSSTSVLDTKHYMRKIGLEGEAGRVMEKDDLEGSRRGLRSGYGQSKWVAEKLVMNAMKRGVPATIIRPGYIVGHSATGVGNTDDFLWRLVKGCIQLGKIPKISNIVNMCPVDYVSSAVAAIAGAEENLKMGVFHIWHPHRFRFDDMFSKVLKYYNVTQIEYIQWRSALMDLTLSSSDHALYPLLHFVLDDLPTSTRSPELDDVNTRTACSNDELRVRSASGSDAQGGALLWRCPDIADLMNVYLGYLVQVGFLPPQQKSMSAIQGDQLPVLKEWEKIEKGNGVVSRSGK